MDKKPHGAHHLHQSFIPRRWSNQFEFISTILSRARVTLTSGVRVSWAILHLFLSELTLSHPLFFGHVRFVRKTFNNCLSK